MKIYRNEFGNIEIEEGATKSFERFYHDVQMQMRRVTGKELAALLGVNPSYVSRMKSAGFSLPSVFEAKQKAVAWLNRTQFRSEKRAKKIGSRRTFYLHAEVTS